MSVIAIIVVIFLLVALVSLLWPVFVIVGGIALGLWLIYSLYQALYFKSSNFQQIKNKIKSYADECNELNAHIEELKSSYINIHHTDFGAAEYTDYSVYKFKRPKLNNLQQHKNIYECSLTVCKNAQQQPFKYVCKYFNIEPNEETLNKFEKVFNDFSAAEQGKNLLKKKKQEIINNFGNRIPFIIKTIGKKALDKKLGFDDIDFSKVYFPQYSFRYVSAGGNSSMQCDVKFDLDNLERFIRYLSEIVRFRKTVAGQRALMTSSLREKIKKRDNYTCQKCGISTASEPHLLLEIDHIIPVSRNGLTTESNLQTLCWKCNRSKGTKI